MADANFTTRRALLKAAPALALVGAVPAKGVASTDTPVMALFRRHQAITVAAASHPVDDDEELERLFYRERDKIEEEMDALPALTAQDMAAKMVVAHSYGDHSCLSYDRNLVWREARALIGA